MRHIFFQSRKGEWIANKQNFYEGGHHHQNVVSAARRPAPTDDAGRHISRPLNMVPMSRAAGFEPPCAASKNEAAARPHMHMLTPERQRRTSVSRAALATSIRPTGAGRPTPPTMMLRTAPPVRLTGHSAGTVACCPPPNCEDRLDINMGRNPQEV